MSDFQSNYGFAHEEKRRNRYSRDVRGVKDQFVADHGSGCSGVLNSTRNTSTSLSNHHWQPQAVEPCMCETSLTCSGSFAKLQGVTRSFKIAQRDASKLQRVFQALQIINIGQKGPSPQATAPAQPSTCP
jgi:hypothetical protein